MDGSETSHRRKWGASTNLKGVSSYWKLWEIHFWNLSKNGFESPNDAPKNTSFQIKRSVLTYLALEGALNVILDQIVNKCAQSFSFMTMFPGRALYATHFVHPNAKFICEKVEKQIAKIEKSKKKSEVSFTTSSSAPSSSGTSFELRKQCQKKHNRDESLKVEKPRTMSRYSEALILIWTELNQSTTSFFPKGLRIVAHCG